MKKLITLLFISTLLLSCTNISEREKKFNTTEEIVMENFKHISNGDMESFQSTISDDFKFVLTGTLKFNNGESFSRTYNGYDSFLNEFLTPALETMPEGLIFNFEKIIANDIGAAVIWNGESEGLYDAYNNQYVYIYEVNDEGLVSSITEYTDLLLTASSLLGQKINTNYKEN